MADNVRLSAGSNDGATIATDDDGVAQHQYVKLEFGADNTQTKVTSSVGLPTDPLDRAARDLGKVDIASLDQLPTADYDTGAGTQTVPMIGIGLPASGGTVAGGTTTNPIQVGDAGGSLTIDGSISILGTVAVTDNSGSLTIDNAQLSVTGGGVEATAMRVTIANDSTGVLSVDDNGGSLTIDNAALSTTGSGTEAGTLRVTIATDSSGVLSVDDNGSTISIDDGAGSITVDGTVAATQSGTWTVQPGNTANTTAWLVSQTPATSGGLSISQTVSAASTNATNVKASAGQLYGWSVFNTNASTRYVKLHNTAGTPTAGTGVVLTIAVPGGGGSNISLDSGIAFSTGLAFTMVTGSATTDATAVASGDLISNLFYK